MSRPAERFGGEALLERLAGLPRPSGRYWVALSGGADSSALLHALVRIRSRLPAPIAALHVNHALHRDADGWEAHCAGLCRQLAVPFVAERVAWAAPPAANIEALAREARYARLARHLAPGELMLTGHHRDDQAETLLLALLRGSGVDGLAAMAPLRRLGRGWLARPLLAFTHAELVHWLRERDLAWLVDPANRDLRHDRNHLRETVLPALERRWPAAAGNLARSAELARETATTLARWAGERLHGATDGPVLHLGEAGAADDAERRLLVRAWLEREGAPGLPGARLREFVAQAADAAPDARTECRWDGWRLHAWDDRLWLSRADACWTLATTRWRLTAPLALGGAAGTLDCIGAPPDAPFDLVVRSRAPGDRLRATGRVHHRHVKDLLREWRIPPWMRAAVPVLEAAGEPVAIGDRAIGDRLAEWLRATGATLRWSPGDAALARAWSAAGNDDG